MSIRLEMNDIVGKPGSYSKEAEVEIKILERIEGLFGRGTLFSTQKDRIIDVEFYSKTKHEHYLAERKKNYSFQDALGGLPLGNIAGVTSYMQKPKRRRIYLQGYYENNGQLEKVSNNTGSIVMFIDMVSPNPCERYNIDPNQPEAIFPFYSNEEEEQVEIIKKWNLEEQWRESYKEPLYFGRSSELTQKPRARWLFTSLPHDDDRTFGDHGRSAIMEVHLDAANLTVLVPKNKNFSTLRFRTCPEFLHLMANEKDFAKTMHKFEKDGDAQSYCALFFEEFKQRIRDVTRGF